MNQSKQKTSEGMHPSMDQWKQLYDLAAKIKELAPWDWMEEDDLFGLQMPETGELGFISVMGSLGEHYSIGIYQGVKGLSGFWAMHELGPKLDPEFILQVPQLQLSFEDRDITTSEDRSVMKALGLKFRGAQAWPQFRSFRPGCLPWYIEQDEAEMLARGLEQALDVAPRFKDDPDVLFPTDMDNHYLVRVNENGTWKDSQMQVDLSYELTLKFPMDLQALEELKRKLPGKVTIEIDLSMFTEPVRENRKDRPYFPYVLMLAEHDSSFILSSELLTPLPTLEAMWEQVPTTVVESLSKTLAPKEIQVQDEFLQSLLQPLGEELGIKIKKVSRLTAINRVKRELKRFMPRY